MIQLRQHQSKAVDIAYQFPRYRFSWDVGTGKTIALLSICREIRMKTVVLCPLSLVHGVWAKDAAHFKDLAVCPLSGAASASNRKKTILHGNWDILVMNYESGRKHAEDFVAAGIRRLICDESQALRNHDSQLTKTCVDKIGPHVESCYMLSATPDPNGKHQNWGQLRLTSPEFTEPNWWRWVYKWFDPIRKTIELWNPATRQKEKKEVNESWAMKPHLAGKFDAMIGARSWYLSKSECLDLPEELDAYRYIKLAPPELAAYKSMLAELTVETKDGQLLEVKSGARMMKLRQITGGGMYHESRYAVLGDSKIKQLADDLEAIGPKPVIIWSMFTAEIDRIKQSIGPKCAIIDGRVPVEKRFEIIKELGKSIQYIVANPVCVGHGVTLTAASYDIFMSPPGYDWGLYHQARGRTHRMGQENKVTHIHYIAENTCDERVLSVLQSRGDSQAAMRAVFKKDWKDKS